MITQRIRLDRNNEAFDAMQKGEVARSVIVFDWTTGRCGARQAQDRLPTSTRIQ